MGLRIGDIIIEANNTRIKTLKQLRKQLEKSIDKGHITLKIIRNDKQIQTTIPLIIE